MNNCDTGISSRDKLNQAEEVSRQDTKAYLEEKFILPDSPPFHKITNFLFGASDQNNLINEEQFDKLLGDKPGREKLAIKISEILKSNPDLAKYMRDYITNETVRSGLLDVYSNDPVTNEKKFNLNKYPKTLLNRLYIEISAWNKANGHKFNNIYINRFTMSFRLPKTVRMKENTGAVAKMFEATQRHSEAVSTRVAEFADEYNSILQRVDDLIESFKSKDLLFWKNKNNGNSQDFKDMLVETFTRMAHGQIVQVSSEMAKKSGIFTEGPGMYIYTQYGPTGKKYKSTGSEIYEYQKPMKLGYDPSVHGGLNNVKIVDHRGNKRQDLLEYIMMLPDLSSDIIGQLENMVKEYRVLDKKVFDKVTSASNASFSKVIDSLTGFFPKLTKKQLLSLFMENDVSIINQSNLLDSETKKQYMKDYKYLEDNFTKYSLVNPFILESVEYEEKINHFPASYHTGEFPIFIKESIATIKENIAELDNVVATTRAEKKRLALEKDELYDSLDAHNRMLKESLDMPVDLLTNNKMVTRRQSKYLKHISNSFDILKMRRDRMVYYDYLKHNMQTIERNILTADLIESLNMTKDENVREYNMALYKRTIGFPDARANLFGIYHSDESFSTRQQLFMKSLRDYWMLKIGGVTSSMVNMAGEVQKMIEFGIDDWRDVADLYDQWKKDPVIAPKLAKLIKDAAITDFEDFFANTIVKDVQQVGLTREASIRVSIAMMGYYHNKDRIGQKQARKQLDKILMDEFGRGIDWNALLSKEEAKYLRKSEKRRKIKNMTSKLVNYAISKEYYMSDSVRKISNRELIMAMRFPTLAAKLASRGLEFWANTVKTHFKAGVMSETEKFLRITSFIHGALKAQKAGLIGLGNLWDLQGRDRVEMIKSGRMMTKLVMDFGMSKNDVGEMHASALGALFGQFAVWKQQKTGSDIELYKKAWKSVRDSESIPKSIVSFIGQLTRFRKYPQSSLRISNPDMAKLRGFLATNGIASLLFDFVLTGTSVFNSPIMRQFAYNTGAIRGVQTLVSPLQTWINLIPVLLIRTAIDNWWEDDEEIERTIAYYLRALPFGTAFSFIYDMMLLMSSYNDEDNRNRRLRNNFLQYVSPSRTASAVMESGYEAVTD